ncbi:MAG: DUF2085 domain-containing protein [Candidatus Micrarchaeota archaeon]
MKYKMTHRYLHRYLGYALYISVVLFLFGPIFIAPFLASASPQMFEFLHIVYSPLCHQLTARSLCYFQNGSILDCIQPGINNSEINVSEKQRIVSSHGILGYKFPVCARDFAMYGAMIIGGAIFPLLRKIDSEDTPRFLYFAIALVPIALDGGAQILGLRQSTNELRLITGFIAGIVIPFYAIPMFNMFLHRSK